MANMAKRPTGYNGFAICSGSKANEMMKNRLGGTLELSPVPGRNYTCAT
jgi:hypothetical protein